MTDRILVVAVFLVGCVAGGVSSQLVVPKANAQQAATLTKWEYTCPTGTDEKDATKVANALGVEGWEMVGLGAYPNGDIIPCFKRPKM